jgi:EAL domain-containing protein (putative c-di-GMP-specific phosphodiesterase class I)
MKPRPPLPAAAVPLRHAVAGLLAVTLAAGGGPLAAGAVSVLVASLLWWRSRAPDAPERVACEDPAAQPASNGAGPTLSADGTLLLYRPLRSLPELHLRGVEAELRWRHPLDGLVPPADWPPEQTAALADALIGAWVGPACARFAAWLPGLRARGAATLWLRLPMPLLEHAGLVTHLAQALTTHGLDPSMLVLRVPLRVNGRQAHLPEAAHRLQALGVTIAVDAFGAGPASLTHLDRLPVRTVCLAPSFVARAGPNTPQRWVVESTARLAQSMGMSTLAEGVAQETQVLALAAMGCELGVGDVCGPWLEAGDWTGHWSAAPAARAA